MALGREMSTPPIPSRSMAHFTFTYVNASRVSGGPMASAEHEPIMRVWGGAAPSAWNHSNINVIQMLLYYSAESINSYA